MEINQRGLYNGGKSPYKGDRKTLERKIGEDSL